LEKAVKLQERHLAEAQDSILEKGKTGYMRLAADADNYRKRRAADQRGLEQSSVAGVLRHFLGLLEAFEVAEEKIKPSTEQEKKYLSNMMSLHRQLQDLYSKLGVTPFFGAQGEPYVSTVHEMAEEVFSEEFEAGTIVECKASGLELSGINVKRALCVVSKGSEVAQEEAPAAAEAGDEAGAE
ncbi:unnamed protein product, partial [Chrysoparadoxa australica]